MLIKHGVKEVAVVGGRLDGVGGASKSSVFNGSIEALVVVGSLEVGLQVDHCLSGCCLLASSFTRHMIV